MVLAEEVKACFFSFSKEIIDPFYLFSMVPKPSGLQFILLFIQVIIPDQLMQYFFLELKLKKKVKCIIMEDCIQI